MCFFKLVLEQINDHKLGKIVTFCRILTIQISFEDEFKLISGNDVTKSTFFIRV